MPPSDLHAHLGYWLRAVSNGVSHRFARRIEAEGVTVAEWAVMRVLYDAAPLAPSALAERMGLTRGAISKLAERLRTKGLILRADSDEDRRAHSLALTAEGRAKVPALAAIADENDAEFFGVLGPDDRKTLESLLKTLVDRRGLSATPID